MGEDIDQLMQRHYERIFRFILHQPEGAEQPKRCPHCMRYTKGIYPRRMNTQFVDDESNWVTCCGECYSLIELEWAERWADYYSMVM